VLISAALSQTGASYYLLTELHKNFIFYTNEHALDEISLVLNTKFKSKPELRTTLFLILGTSGTQVLPNPSKKDLKPLSKVINPEDAPILASALMHCSHLVTLDNDFMSESVVKHASTIGIVIAKPASLLKVD
jgi:predicted nucleic acid-binding protein